MGKSGGGNGPRRLFLVVDVRRRSVLGAKVGAFSRCVGTASVEELE